MRWKGYGDRRVLIFQKGKLGQNAWNKVTWLRRTLENTQDEILHNSISPLGLNPEVRVENFPYIRWRKTIVGLQQKISYSPPSPHTTNIMPSTPQLSPTKLHQQVEEMKRAQEAWEKEEHEREEALLQAAEEEEKQEAERKQREEEERKR